MNQSNIKVQVNKNEFKWDQINGLLTFDGAPALLFWDSAIEHFLRTIEEVSGKDVSKTVYEATGYRMGELVSFYYKGRIDIEQLLVEYSDIYRSAGWGNVKITEYSFEENKAVVQLSNSWEQRIFSESSKDNACVLLPSHWAGVFSGIFQQSMWYKFTARQVDGNDYDEIEIFPSSITPNKNIYELTRQKEQQSIMELEQKVKDRTEELSTLVKELSSPVIPVLDGILVIPLIGKFNDERISDLIESALNELSRQQANYLLIDMTGLTHVDLFTINGVQKLIQSIRLLGGECILVGISAELGIQMTASGVDLSGTKSFSTLQQGVEFAIKQNGYDLVKRR